MTVFFLSRFFERNTGVNRWNRLLGRPSVRLMRRLGRRESQNKMTKAKRSSWFSKVGIEPRLQRLLRWGRVPGAAPQAILNRGFAAESIGRPITAAKPRFK